MLSDKFKIQLMKLQEWSVRLCDVSWYFETMYLWEIFHGSIVKIVISESIWMNEH